MDVGTARGKFELDGLQKSIDQLEILIDAIKKANVELRTSRGEQVKLVKTYKELFPAIDKVVGSNRYFKGSLTAVKQAIAENRSGISLLGRAYTVFGQQAIAGITASSKSNIESLNRVNDALLRHQKRFAETQSAKIASLSTSFPALKKYFAAEGRLIDNVNLATRFKDIAADINRDLAKVKAPFQKDFFTTKGLFKNFSVEFDKDINRRITGLANEVEQDFKDIQNNIKLAAKELKVFGNELSNVARDSKTLDKDLQKLEADKKRNQQKGQDLQAALKTQKRLLGIADVGVAAATSKNLVSKTMARERIASRIAQIETQIARNASEQVDLQNRENTLLERSLAIEKKRAEAGNNYEATQKRITAELQRQASLEQTLAEKQQRVLNNRQPTIDNAARRVGAANDRMASYGSGYMDNNKFANIGQKAFSGQIGKATAYFSNLKATIGSVFSYAGPRIDNFIGKVGKLTNSIKSNVDLSNTWWKRYGEVATGFWIAYRAINAFEIGVTKLTQTFMNGMRIQDSYVEGAATIAGMLALTSTGLSGFQERYTRIHTVMMESIKEATRLAPQYRLSMDEVVEGYKELSQFGVLVTKDITDKSLNAIAMIKMIAKTTGSDVRQVRQEIQALFTGTTRVTDQFGRMIKIMMPDTYELFRSISEGAGSAQDKWKGLIDRIYEYKYAVTESNKTVSGQMEIAQNNMSVISSYALTASGVYDKIVNSIKAFNLSLFDKKGNLTEYGKEVYYTFYRTWQIIGKVYDAFTAGIKYIYDAVKAFVKWYDTSESVGKSLVTRLASILLTVAKLNIALQATWFLLNVIGKVTGLNFILSAFKSLVTLGWKKRLAILAIIKATFDWQAHVLRLMYFWSKLKLIILNIIPSLKLVATRMWAIVAPVAMLAIKVAAFAALFAFVYKYTQKAAEEFAYLVGVVKEFGSILKKAFTEGFTSVDWGSAVDQILAAGQKAMAEQAAMNKSGNDMIIGYAKEKFLEFTNWMGNGTKTLLDKLKLIVSGGVEGGQSLANRLLGLEDVKDLASQTEQDIKALLEGINFASGIAGKGGEANKALASLLERRKEIIVSYFKDLEKIKGDINEVLGVSTLNRSIIDANNEMMEGLSKLGEMEREFNNVGEAIKKLGLKYTDFKGVDLSQKEFPTSLVVAFQEALLKLRDVKIVDAHRIHKDALLKLSHAYDEVVFATDPLGREIAKINEGFEDQVKQLTNAGFEWDTYFKLIEGRNISIELAKVNDLLRQQASYVSVIRDAITGLDDAYERYIIRTPQYLNEKLGLLDQIYAAESANLELTRQTKGEQSSEYIDQQLRLNDINRERLALMREQEDFNWSPSFNLNKAFERFNRDIEKFGKTIQDSFYNIFTSMQSTLSDVFFDWMSGELKDAEDYWKAFGDVVNRVLADILAQLASREIASLLFGGGGGSRPFSISDNNSGNGLVGSLIQLGTSLIGTYLSTPTSIQPGSGQLPGYSTAPGTSIQTPTGGAGVLPGIRPNYNGGLIKEPVIGFGLNTGQSYSFAERGPERVLSNEDTRAYDRNSSMSVNVPITINGEQNNKLVVALRDEIERTAVRVIKEHL